MARIMWMVVIGVLVAAAGRADAGPGWTPVDRVIAVVDREVILDSEVERRIRELQPRLDAIKDPAERGRQRAQLHTQVVRSLVDEQLVISACARAGIQVSDPEVD